MDAVPCEHIAANVLSLVICPQITPINVMPIWCKRKQWRVQFPLEVYAEANITIELVKEGQISDHSWCLSPNWTAVNKSERLKKGECHKTNQDWKMPW